MIFVLTCICFGFSCRIFERHYWETQDKSTSDFQDWNFEWNAFWCIFVAMLTVGYGDFYPKTHLGRFIVIVACMVGTYFVSMMMVFMTQKSILNETEFKAYKLVTRLKLRKEIKNIQSFMVHICLKMNILKIQLRTDPHNQELKDKYMNERRRMIHLISEIKSKYRAIKTFEFVPTKEQLVDVCERIDTDIKEIMVEIDSLKVINEEMINYTDNQIEAIKYIKKNIFATRLIYSNIQKHQCFGKLNNVDHNILKEDEEFEEVRRNTVSKNEERNSATNISEFECEENMSSFDKNCHKYFTNDELKAHFSYLFLQKNHINNKLNQSIGLVSKKSNVLISPLKKSKKKLHRMNTKSINLDRD